MKKFLRTMLLMACMLVPWVTNAQETVTIGTGTSTTYYVPFNSLYGYSFTEQVYSAADINMAGSITKVRFHLGTSNSSVQTNSITLWMKNVSRTSFTSTTDIEPVTTSDVVYNGSWTIPANYTGWVEIELTTPFIYDGTSNLMVAMHEYTSGYSTRYFTYTSVTNAGISYYSDSYNPDPYNLSSYSGSKAQRSYLANMQLDIVAGDITCWPVKNLAIVDSLTTSESLTFSWIDTNNSGATYNIYRIVGNDTTLLDDVSDTSYTIDTLQPNTAYTFGVETDCGGGDVTRMRIVSGRTNCAAYSIPYTCGFEADEIMSTNQADALPWCSVRFPFTGSYPNYPYSNSSNAHSGSRSLYFYGTTSTSYPDSMAIILPAIDIDDYPMSDNRIAFWARTGSASDSKPLYIGTMSNAANRGDINWLDTVTITGSTYRLYSVSLADADYDDAHVVMMVRQGSGNIYVDDIVIEVMPSCFEVSDLNVDDSLTTATTVTLTWRDEVNTDATYSVYVITPTATEGVFDTTLVESSIDDTIFTVEDLTGNTSYTFAVKANCSSEDAHMVSVSTRTACIIEPLPFSEDFSEALVSCWNGASAQASQVFAGTPLTMGAPSTGWNHTTDRDGFTGGHYYKNVYGTSVYHWLITPSIDLAEVESAVLHFDMALTDYSYAAAPEGPYTGGQRFMVIVSTDNGQTWSASNATVWNQDGTNADYAFANVPWSEFATYVVNLNQYIGDTVRIAFYCESLTSGGDNDLHIDNVFISEAGAPLVSLPSTMAASLGNPFEIAATLIDGEQPVTYTWSSTMEDAGNASSVASDSVFTITYTAVGNDTVKVIASNAMGVDSAITVVNVACQPANSISVAFGEDGETTLSWNGTAAEYEYALTLQSGTLDTNDVNTTTETSVTIDTLTSGVAYKFYVRATCGSYHSTWISKTFTPGEYILAANSTDTLHTCGAIVYDDGGPNGTYAHNQNSTLVILPPSPDKWLVISGTSQTEGSYDYTTIYNGVGAGREQLFKDNTSSDNTQHTFGPFTCPFGATIEFHSDVSNTYAGFAVNVTCIDAPDCLPVNGFAIVDSLTTAHTATFVWTGEADSYQIEYRPSTDTNWIEETVNDTIAELTGLDPVTTYNVRVKSLCGSDESDYSRVITFTTTVACPAPSNLRAVLTPGDGTTATLVWSDPTGSAWQICLNGDTNYIDVTDSTSYTFDTLTPEQAYTAKVRRDCTEEQEGYSTWSSTITFVPTNAYSLIVNDGTTTNSYVPIYGTYVDDHIHTRFIIPAASLSQIQFGIINKLVFHASNTSVTWSGASFQVYMTETDATTVSSVVPTDDMQQVYTGSLSIANNKMEVTFSAPYQYMGGNLMIAFEQPTSGSWSSCSWYGVNATGASMGGYGSSVSQQNFLPKTTIYFTPGDEPTCFPVSDLVVVESMTTEESLTVSWMDTINDAASYNVYLVNGDDTTTYTTSDTIYTIENLQHSTAYTILVAADCGGDVAIVRSVEGHTACGAITTFPWSEDFENYASGNLNINCWENVHITGGGSQIFKIYTSTNGNNSTHQLQLPDMTSGTQTKLVLPPMELDEDTRYMFSIDIYRNTNSYPNEGVRVFVSTTGEIAGAHELGFLYRNYQQTDGGVVHAETASAWYTYDFIIPDSISGTVNIILRGESSYGSSTYMDNLVVMVAPQCLQPAGVSVSDIEETGATIHINDPEDNGSYHVVLLSGTDTAFNEVVSDTVITIDTLNGSTTYSVIVTAVCEDGTETRAVSTVFRTPCTSITVFPWTETFEAADLGCWSSEGQGQWTIGVGNGTVGSAYQGQSNAKITHSSNGYITKLISPVLDAGSDANGIQLSFAHVQSAWAGDIDAHRVLYRTSAGGSWTQVAEYTQAIASWTVDSVMLPGDVYQIAFEFTDNYGYGVGIDNVVLTVMGGDYCFPVSDLAVESVTGSSVTLTWSSNAGSFTVMNGNVQVATGITDTVYTVTGLDASTSYTFSVIADCSPTSSSDPRSITALTDCGDGGCAITIVATDGYGDGWNGAYIDIMQNGVSIATCSATDQGLEDTPTTETFTYQVCSSSPVTFVWHSGDYDDEASFVIKNANDSVLYTVAAADALSDGATFYTATNPCEGVPIIVPDTFYVTLNSANSTMGTVSPAGVTAVADGGSFTATATAATGYHFVNWTDAAGTVVSTANPYTFSVTADVTLIGTFEANSTPTYYTVSVSSADSTMGTVSCTPSGSVEAGTSVTATATPATNHIFTGWVNAAGDTVSTANPYTFTVTADITLVGTFRYNGVGIETVSLDNVSLFPNPASTSVTISGLEAKAMVTLVDINGHVSGQWTAKDNTLTIDLTNYATGTYFVRIVGEQAMAVRKLIIK